MLAVPALVPGIDRRLMPIRPFLADRPFDPEMIREMSRALEAVCEALNRRMADDAATRSIAEKIIELAQRGVKSADAFTALTLKEIKE
jgi:hypothetical protein